MNLCIGTLKQSWFDDNSSCPQGLHRITVSDEPNGYFKLVGIGHYYYCWEHEALKNKSQELGLHPLAIVCDLYEIEDELQDSTLRRVLVPREYLQEHF